MGTVAIVFESYSYLINKLFGININPISYNDKGSESLSRGWTQKFDSLGQSPQDIQLLACTGPAQMDSVAITHISQRPFLHYWKLLLIVSEAEFNLQFPQ